MRRMTSCLPLLVVRSFLRMIVATRRLLYLSSASIFWMMASRAGFFIVASGVLVFFFCPYISFLCGLVSLPA